MKVLILKIIIILSFITWNTFQWNSLVLTFEKSAPIEMLVSFSLLLFFFKLCLSSLRRHFVFTGLLQLLLAFSSISYVLDYYHKGKIHQFFTTSEQYARCPIDDIVLGSSDFGSGFGSSTPQVSSNETEKEKTELTNDKDEDEEIIRPCLNRYIGEPLLSYMVRRSKFMFFELILGHRNNDYLLSIEKLKYKFNFRKEIAYEAPVENSRAHYNVYYPQSVNSSELKNLFHELFISSSIIKSNLSKDSFHYIKLESGETCQTVMNDIRVKEEVEKRIEVCNRLAIKDITKTCYNRLFEKGKDKTIPANICSEYRFKEFALKENILSKGNILCDQSSLVRSYKNICLDTMAKTDETYYTFLDRKIPLYTIAYHDALDSNFINELTKTLFNFNPSIDFEDSKRSVLTTHTLLDEFDTYLDSKNKYSSGIDKFHFFQHKDFLNQIRPYQAVLMGGLQND